jgi:ABC-2 type transport system permease protein
MSSYNAYVVKEFKEIIRTKKLIIFSVAFLFFAFLDPVMLKLMPVILKSQLGDIPIEALGYKNAASAAMTNFSGDLFEIATLVVALTIMGITASERSERTIVLPEITGLGHIGAIFAKLTATGLVLSVINIFSFFIALIYSNLIFGTGDTIAPLNVLLSSLYYSVYLFFIAALCILFGSISGKGVFAGIGTLVASYGGAALQGLFPKVKEYFPYHMISVGAKFDGYSDGLYSILITAALIIVFCIVSANVLRNREQ